MKGIILAGGTGTRLSPLTVATSKQLLPIYDKPMIYYPLSMLMEAGIRDIMMISTPQDLPRYRQLLGDGQTLGLQLQYCEQLTAAGIAQAFTLCATWIGNEAVTLILGDNFFYGPNLKTWMKKAITHTSHQQATIFSYPVAQPERYGIVELDSQGHIMSLQEKPTRPSSNLAVTGLYFYDHTVVQIAKNITPSARGELEITSINQYYLEQRRLLVQPLDSRHLWLDMGTIDSLHEASVQVKQLQTKHQRCIASPEYIAYDNGWISEQQFLENVNRSTNSQYGQHLRSMYRTINR